MSETNNSARRHTRNGAGFSVLEMLIAAATLMIVMGTVATLLINLQKGHIAEQDVAEVQQNQRFAMDVILRALRGAGNDPQGIGFAMLDLDPNGDGQQNDLRVRSDFNPADGDLDDAEEVILFSRVGSVLRVTDASTGASSDIAQNISGLSFEYFDAAGNVTATVASVVRVRVTLTGTTTRRDPRSGEFRTLTLVDEGTIRSNL